MFKKGFEGEWDEHFLFIPNFTSVVYMWQIGLPMNTLILEIFTTFPLHLKVASEFNFTPFTSVTLTHTFRVSLTIPILVLNG